jgi:glycerol-3-phosphate dehydrogenase
MSGDRIRVEVAIFGGGIAGLWLLARLRAAGYSALLLESRALGGIQTIASQGIIHGGAKYALSGNLTASARAIGEMPRVWRDCLTGDGELDLSTVRVLSDHQYLWSTENIVSRVAGFFASHVMRSRMIPLASADRPEPFRNPDFHGTLYRLEEPVLDVASLVAELVRQQEGYCHRLPAEGYSIEAGAEGAPFRIRAGAGVEIEARRLVLAAGAGNAGLLQRLGRERPAMQLRPLHMVMARGELPELYAHCLGSGTTPRITVTSYPLGGGRTAWYLGGQLAESGVARSEPEQLAAAQTELRELLPWIDFSELEWASLRIDRAEPRTVGGRRPESCFVDLQAGIITAWPTKLAFAPRLAQEVIERLQQDGLPPGGGTEPHPSLICPPMAELPWQEAQPWS